MALANRKAAHEVRVQDQAASASSVSCRAVAKAAEWFTVLITMSIILGLPAQVNDPIDSRPHA